jgi:hypothetical protein
VEDGGLEGERAAADGEDGHGEDSLHHEHGSFVSNNYSNNFRILRFMWRANNKINTLVRAYLQKCRLSRPPYTFPCLPQSVPPLPQPVARRGEKVPPLLTISLSGQTPPPYLPSPFSPSLRSLLYAPKLNLYHLLAMSSLSENTLLHL